ncbi:MAG: efflux transporter outer membrane subunit [Culturomica sp.]|jgi:multidrug efflux system outer membrane protein|nr:efflux transporter outer membrane subunit [Culturomica sp.]
MKANSIIYVLILSFAFVSCKVGSKYGKHEMNLPASLDTASQQGLISIGELQWKDVFRDSVLQLMISESLTLNKDMLIAVAKVKEAKAMQRTTRADIFPSVGAKLAGEREYAVSGSNTFEAKALLSWEVDLWGKLRWADQAALAAYMQTVEGVNALRLTLIADVVSAYFELIALDGELSIVKQTLEAQRKSMELVRLRFEGGITSETVLRQSQVELAKTENLLPTLERSIRLKENELSLLIGKYPHKIVRNADIRFQTSLDTLPVGLPSELLERRPDIRQADYQLREANAEIGVAYASMFPSISLTGQYGFESSELSDLLSGNYFDIAGQLLAPIFNAGKNRARLRAKKAVFEQKVYAYEKTVLTAFKEVNDALLSLRKTKEIKKSYFDLQSSASVYLELAKLQYINGVIDYLDVLDAQRVYFDARTGYNNAARDELLDLVMLYKSLGGGWK